MSLKNPVTPPGIDPVIVRLVVQRLNHYATPGPIRKYELVPGILHHRFLTNPFHFFFHVQYHYRRHVVRYSNKWRRKIPSPHHLHRLKIADTAFRNQHTCLTVAWLIARSRGKEKVWEKKRGDDVMRCFTDGAAFCGLQCWAESS